MIKDIEKRGKYFTWRQWFLASALVGTLVFDFLSQARSDFWSFLSIETLMMRTLVEQPSVICIMIWND